MFLSFSGYFFVYLGVLSSLPLSSCRAPLFLTICQRFSPFSRRKNKHLTKFTCHSGRSRPFTTFSRAFSLRSTSPCLSLRQVSWSDPDKKASSTFSSLFSGHPGPPGRPHAGAKVLRSAPADLPLRSGGRGQPGLTRPGHRRLLGRGERRRRSH